MPAADVARLRFVMSADSGGLKSGCKDAIGSLKDMSDQTGRSMQRMDSGGINWKGLKRSARSLKFVGREMGGMFKGVLGDAIGIAATGAAMGPMGAALAAGAVGVNMYQEHQKQLEEDRTKAALQFREASVKGLDAATYRSISSIAGDDTKFLDDLAVGMKRLADAGPNASQQLKQFGQDVENFKLSLGLQGKEGKAVEQSQLAFAGEKRLENAGLRKDWFGGDQADAMTKHFAQKYQDEGLGEKDAWKKARAKMRKFTTWSVLAQEYQLTGGGFGDPEEQTKAYKEAMAEYEADLQSKQKKLVEKAEIQGKGQSQALGLRTNKEKLEGRLKEIDKIKSAGGYGETNKENEVIAGRAAHEAIDEYKKAQGMDKVNMAGAAQYGSVEAYSTIAQSQMGAAAAENSTAETNALLEKHFPDLIQAVKSLKPDWRRAETTT